jgi:hypothetical protein
LTHILISSGVSSRGSLLKDFVIFIRYPVSQIYIKTGYSLFDDCEIYPPV